MEDFDDVQCEDFYGEAIFDDVDQAQSEEDFDIDEAVERMYHAIYGAR